MRRGEPHGEKLRKQVRPEFSVGNEKWARAEDSEAAKAGHKNICEIGKERIRRAGEKILAEWTEKQKSKENELALDGDGAAGVRALPPDIGFRVFKVPDSKPRNEIIARAMSWTSYVEKSGSGTGDIINKCRAWGLPDPEYCPDNVDFKTIIWRKEKVTPVTNLPPVENLPQSRGWQLIALNKSFWPWLRERWVARSWRGLSSSSSTRA